MSDAALTTVEVGSAPIERYRPLLEEGTWAEFERAMAQLAQALHGRTLWNVNSTPRGGGVAELLSALIPYDRGAGIDARWVAIEGSPGFFGLTKKLHTWLHGVDGSHITEADGAEYERALRPNAAALMKIVKPRDVIILHDPQTAGLAPALAGHGCRVIWRCHIGVDEPNQVAKGAWRFLGPYVNAAQAVVFSRRNYVWENVDQSRVTIIPPSIDAFATKNRELDGASVMSILGACGIMRGAEAEAILEREGAPPIHVRRRVQGLPDGGLPTDARIVVQVSRWDRLKDPLGVMDCFVRHVAPQTSAHLILAGPAATSVTDDPEQPEILAQMSERREQLPPEVRRRVHTAQLPMEDEDENAAIVNALQRRADVVVQKSLAEGFGLTVAEAMWKSRPVVASRVGGIGDQIEDGTSGVLIDDPQDLEGFGGGVVRLLGNQREARRLGEAARLRVTRQYLAPRHLMQQGALIRGLLD